MTTRPQPPTLSTIWWLIIGSLWSFSTKQDFAKKKLPLDDMRKIAVESGMFPDWFIPAFETSSFLICFFFQYSLNIIYNYWLTVIAPASDDSYCSRGIAPATYKYVYYSFKIFPRFWLAKCTHIIHHNQPLMTKFGRILRLINRWRHKYSFLTG